MKISKRNVKEVLLKTNYVFMMYNPDYYHDLLRISKSEILYKRTNLETRKVTANWSLKTTSENYARKYEKLIEALANEQKNPHERVVWTDCGDFNLRVTFIDDTHIDFHGTHDLYSNGLDDIAIAILDMIPQGEAYSDLLNEFDFNRVNLTKSVLAEMDKERLVGLMYAERGAMGYPGEIEIVDESGNVYSNVEGYTGEPIPKEEIVNQVEVTALFDGFEHHFILRQSIKELTLNRETWVYISLGMGNHLYLRKDFYQKVGNRIIDVKVPRCYKNWKTLTKRELKKMG